MNSNADSRRVCFWSSSSLVFLSSCICGDTEDAGEADGEEAGGDEEFEEAPCLDLPLTGNGLPTVSVGPQSTGGSIRPGRWRSGDSLTLAMMMWVRDLQREKMQVRGGYLALEREGREILKVGRRLQRSDKLLTQGEQHARPRNPPLAVAQQTKQ